LLRPDRIVAVASAPVPIEFLQKAEGLFIAYRGQ
jgi:hypothetical protein